MKATVELEFKCELDWELFKWCIHDIIPGLVDWREIEVTSEKPKMSEDKAKEWCREHALESLCDLSVESMMDVAPEDIRRSILSWYEGEMLMLMRRDG